ncbi:hypothetical protein TRSC58_07233 [Trypanosoma rangeli SC58]|uniref:Uncharacterized protein n=1 Tax=Trypanosoma rangeli SC58 TaxID=429131 RepID=A0A061IS61_TRYRA|nr:hypothetical protein TRSC58_07233 [Trypanosoma rangeli SC58]
MVSLLAPSSSSEGVSLFTVLPSPSFVSRRNFSREERTVFNSVKHGVSRTCTFPSPVFPSFFPVFSSLSSPDGKHGVVAG